MKSAAALWICVGLLVPTLTVGSLAEAQQQHR